MTTFLYYYIKTFVFTSNEVHGRITPFTEGPVYFKHLNDVGMMQGFVVGLTTLHKTMTLV